MTGKRFTVEEMQNWDKRFKIDKEDTTKIIDTFNGGEYWTVHGNEAYNLCIELNHLHEENHSLKNKVSFLEEFITSGVEHTYSQNVYEENEQLKTELQGMEELLKSYRKTIKHDAELLADATKNGYLPPLEDWKGDVE